MNTKFFKYIIPALSLVFSVNFTSCLGDLDVTPIDPNLNVEFDQNANFAKIYAGLAITGNKGPDGQGDIADTDEGASGLMRMLFNLNELPTDEAICAWSGDVDVYPLNFAKFTASNGVVLNMFNRLYIQIAQCNNFLIQTEGKDDEESLTQRAEVRFIRALDYYYLIDSEILQPTEQRTRRYLLFSFIYQVHYLNLIILYIFTAENLDAKKILLYFLYARSFQFFQICS